MEKKYYLHRISHESDTSYYLLKKGILTLGWEKFADSEILDAAREEGYPRFDVITGKLGESHNRSRWNIWYFAQMQVGDIVVVPLYSGEFSIFKIDEIAKPIAELEKTISSLEGEWNKHNIEWREHRLYDINDDYKIDLGFYLKVSPIIENIPRNIVGGKFSSRMKIRTACIDITDISSCIEETIVSVKEDKPITLYGRIKEEVIENIRTSIISTLNPDKFEQLVKWYLDKCGASSVWIPAKKETGKTNGADADIVAEFDNLHHIVYVQAKWHDGVTSGWAVHQIDNYKSQKAEEDSSYTYATWVISSANNFSEEAVAEAENRGVRLIDGSEFARMLMDIGFLGIDEAFETNFAKINKCKG